MPKMLLELSLAFHSGCHGNRVTIATSIHLMPIIPRKPHGKDELNTT